MNDTAIFAALLREGALAAEMLATGVTMLRKANTSDVGLFSLSFFGLSIGMERAAKIAIVLDYYLSNNHAFPSDEHLKKNFGHDVARLFSAMIDINQKRRPVNEQPEIPDSDIHKAIIQTLSDFGKVTRYHNLDLLLQGKGASMKSPEVAWLTDVGGLILSKHYKPKKRAKDAAKARSWEQMLSSKATVYNLGANSQFITSVGEAFAHRQKTELIQRHAQFYTLQIIRYLTETLMMLQTDAHRQQLESVPFFSELFACFYNDDSYFRSRKTWTTRR